jgi:hypothetical protein
VGIINTKWERHRTGSAALLALFVVLLGVPVFACGLDEEARGDSPWMPPRAFADDSAAELATDGRDALWLLVTGYEGRRFAAKVFLTEGGDWTEMPALAEEVGNDGPANIAVAKLAGAEEVPCVGYSEAGGGKPLITCWVGGQWQRQPLPSSMRNARLVQMSGSQGQLTALFQGNLPSGKTAFQVIRLGSSGWEAIGPRIKTPAALAQLGSDSPDDSGSPLIGVETQGSTPKRYVLALRGGDWVRLGPVFGGPGLGPLLGGPVTSGRSIFMPVNDAEQTPWTFSVLSIRAGLGATTAQPNDLSVDAGNAQGKIYEVGNDRAAWATWREDEPLRSGAFRTRIYAARLSARTQVIRKVRLWGGVSIGPGSTQVIEFRGRLLALYMPSASREDQGLRATVRTIPAS